MNIANRSYPIEDLGIIIPLREQIITLPLAYVDERHPVERIDHTGWSVDELRVAYSPH